MGTLFRPGFDDAGPKRHWRFRAAPKRIQIGADQPCRQSAARGGPAPEDVVVGQDQIGHLMRIHLQRLLAQEGIERIRRAVLRHLKDAFVDGEENQSRGAIRAVAERQFLARANHWRRGEFDAETPRAAIDGERRHGVAQGTDEDLLGIDGADEGDVHIGVAFQALWHADTGKRRIGVAAEPREGVHVVAFDGRQARAGIGRRDLHDDLFAGRVFGAVQLEVEFRVALEIAGEIASAGHRERHAAQHRALGVHQMQCEAARRGRRQRVVRPLCRHRERLAGEFGFLQHRLIGESAVALLHERGNVAAFEQHRFEVGQRRLAGVGGQGHEAYIAQGFLGDEGQVAVRRVAHQRRRRREQRASDRPHALTAVGLEALDG